LGALRRRLFQALLPATLFGRLALLLMGVALLSHVLALTALFEVTPHPRGALPSPLPMPPIGALLDIGVRLSALAVAAWIAAAWIAGPVKRLAAATQALGQGLAGPVVAALPDEGPRELREANRGFNRMQERIFGHLRERDRFVAAVSHDLRTPLTRLRLRAEELTEPGQRECFQRDIAEMETMISATLDCFRGAARGEPLALLDVQALAESMAEDQRACGHVVSCSGAAAPLVAAPSALRRCIVNLVDNAVRYGGSAHITLHDGATELRIAVRDSGPGIAEAELPQVLQPFHRLEASRNRSTGGVGLGLAIAHDIARQHCGTLVLHNALPTGLVATLTLPR
jgi:protein-histidine pros-kinase